MAVILVFLALLFCDVALGAERTRLTSDVVVSSSNIQATWDDYADNYDLAGYNVLVNMVPGTYTNSGLHTSKCLVGQKNAKAFTVDGNGSIFYETDNKYNFEVGSVTTGEGSLCTKVKLQNMELAASSGGGINSNGGLIVVAGLTLGEETLVHFNSSGTGANILFDYGTTIKLWGGASSFGAALSSAMIIMQGVTVDCGHASMRFPVGFAQASYPAGQFYGSFSTFVNCENVQGPRYYISYVGALVLTSTVPVDQNYFPGNEPGTLEAGSQYR